MRKNDYDSPTLSDIIYQRQRKKAYEYAEKRKHKEELYKIKYGKAMPQKQKLKFSKVVIPISIFAVVAYTVADFILQKSGFGEMSATLTTSFFCFFGTELVTLCGIKVTDTIQDRIKFMNGIATSEPSDEDKEVAG